VSLAWVGEARTTIVGEQYGGRRVDGRASFDVMIGRSAGPRQIGYVSLFAAFMASELRATPSRSPIDSAGERRIGYATLLGVGIGL
jgi:hypothetical protein